MAYFSNGEEGDRYQNKYCERCVNWRVDPETDAVGCSVMDLHWLWNYDAVGDNADETKKEALNHFIPEKLVKFDNGTEGMFPAKCRMFLEKQENE